MQSSHMEPPRSSSRNENSSIFAGLSCHASTSSPLGSAEMRHLVRKRSPLKQRPLALKRKRRAIHRPGYGEHAIQVVNLVLEQLRKDAFNPQCPLSPVLVMPPQGE